MKGARFIRLLLPVLIVVMIVYGSNQAKRSAGAVREITYRQFLQAVDDDAVQSGALDKNVYRGRFISGAAFQVSLETVDSKDRQNLLERLAAHGVRNEGPSSFELASPRSVVASICFLLALIGMVYWLFLRRSSAAAKPL